MNYKIKTIALLFACLAFSSAQAQQPKELTNYLNYNHQNKIRFEWPINEKSKIHLDAILETVPFVQIITASQDKIAASVSDNMPTVILIKQMKVLVEMEIDKSIKTFKYRMFDSLQIFVGIHQIVISTKDDKEIRIFFDDAENLKLLSEINFDTLYSELSKDFKNLTYVQKYRSNEVMYQNHQEKISLVGNIKREGKLGLGGSVGYGVMFDNRGLLGIGSTVDVGLVSFAKNNYEEYTLRYKFSLELKAYVFGMDNNVFGSYGLRWMSPTFPKLNKAGLDLMGCGLAYYSYRDNIDREDGVSFSVATESKMLFMSYDVYFPFNRDDLTRKLYTSITLGLKFW